MPTSPPRQPNNGDWQPMLPFASSNNDEGSQALEDYIESAKKSAGTTLADAMDRYDLVDADPSHGYIVMAEKQSKASKDPGISTETALREFGYSSPSPFTAWTREEHVSELRDRSGLQKWYRMKRSDGTVRGALRALKTPIQSAHWFVQPASDSTRDKNVAEFLEENLFRGLNVSWSCFLDDVLLMCEYGHMIFEKVFIPDDKTSRMKIAKLAPRHPLDVREWRYDDNGGPDGVLMEPVGLKSYSSGQSGAPNDTSAGYYNSYGPVVAPEESTGIFIPIEKLVIFSLEAEAGDLRGISVLRSAYKHFYYKDTLYKIDAIQKERHGIGIPIIKLPPNFGAQDRKDAEQLGRNLRTNERAHITLPPLWEIIFAKIEGHPVDCMTSISHHDERIMTNILAAFMTNSSGTKSEELDIFYKSTRYIASTITETFNRHVIKQLVDMNYSKVGYPSLHAKRIGEWEDLRTQSFAIRNHVGAGIIIPDDELEKHIRADLDLPQPDPKTSRKAASPQNPNDPNAQQQPNPNDPNQPNPNDPQNPAAQKGQKPQQPTSQAKQANTPAPPGPPKVGPPRQSTPKPPPSNAKRSGVDRSGGH